MKKYEFLEELQTILTGELPDHEVENHIRFYDDYIKTQSSNITEDEVMEQLGDPRLIAKTIIETYQMTHTPLYNANRHERAYQDIHTSNEENYNDQQGNNDDHSNRNGKQYAFQFKSQLTWYQKLIFAAVLILLITVVIIIGGILIQVFFTFGIPLILILIIYKLFKNNIRK